MFSLPGLGPRGVKAGLSRVRWSLGRRGAVCVSGLASTLGCVGEDCHTKGTKWTTHPFHYGFHTALQRISLDHPVWTQNYNFWWQFCPLYPFYFIVKSYISFAYWSITFKLFYGLIKIQDDSPQPLHLSLVCFCCWWCGSLYVNLFHQFITLNGSALYLIDQHPLTVT